MGKLILITASLLISFSVLAERKNCYMDMTHILDYASFNDVSTSQAVEKVLQRECKGGDILTWVLVPPHYRLKQEFYRPDQNYSKMGMDIVAQFCFQENEITASNDFFLGVCTYTGNPLWMR